mmetsp:Transcript_5773/g.10157  ORF Transcript_5773/g.10157 Transcript_5773/m.10157 type:complete len:83 (+) Transcript_5773:47-295(+)
MASRTKKAYRQRTTYYAAKKSASSSKTRGIAAKRSPATSSVTKKLSHDVCLLSSSDDESPNKQPITIRKPPTSEYALKGGRG